MDLSNQIGGVIGFPHQKETYPPKVAIKDKIYSEIILLNLYTPRVSHERKKPKAPLQDDGDLLISKARQPHAFHSSIWV